MRYSQFINYLSGKIITPSRSYEEWHSKYFNFQKVAVENKKLAKEIENLANNKGGYLTFGEFINVEMFGLEGFYKKHKDFGKTNVHSTWPRAIIEICRKSDINLVVEVGSGDGSLAINTLNLAKKEKISLKWIAVEENKKLLNEINKRKIPNLVSVNSIEKVKPDKHLIIFPFSLDSMPSEILINTSSNFSPANNIVGIKIAENKLQEVILDKEVLKFKGFMFAAGILKVGDFTFDYSSIKLQSFQRNYVPISGYLSIINAVKKMKVGSEILIIDEVKIPPDDNYSYHYGFPRILSYKRDYGDIEKPYKRVGDNLWYFPFYLMPMLDFLKQIGFSELEHDIDKRLSARLEGSTWSKPGYYLCYGIRGKYKNLNKNKNFKILSPVINN